VKRTSRITGLFGLLGLLGLIGCSERPAADFGYAETTKQIVAVPYGPHKSPVNPIEAELRDNFGTPNQLIVSEVYPIDYGKAVETTTHPDQHKDGWKIKQGRNLYMLHCLHCHGTGGDGNGPTAQYLNPRPRDYRNGVFKFTSTGSGLKPSRHDLKTILVNGIPGTSMPSFMLLGDEEISLIVEYVRFLSMRGEFERRVYDNIKDFATADAVRAVIKEGTSKTDAEQQVIDKLVAEKEDLFEIPATDTAETWETSENPETTIYPREATVLNGAKLYSQVEPRPKESETPTPTGRVKVGERKGSYIQVKSESDEELGWVEDSKLEARTGLDLETRQPTIASIRNGKKLFLSDDLKCYQCHGTTGRGDGPNTEVHWPIPKTTPERFYEKVGLHDEWGQPIQPRNLTRGLYRGGRRPIDLYRRLYAGIKGTPMPSYSTGKFQGKDLTDSDFWDIINFVQTLPFEPASGTKPASEAKSKVASTGHEPAGHE